MALSPPIDSKELAHELLVRYQAALVACITEDRVSQDTIILELLFLTGVDPTPEATVLVAAGIRMARMVFVSEAKIANRDPLRDLQGISQILAEVVNGIE